MRARPLPRSLRRAGGFTFIELLTVIAILALLASVVVVNMDNMSAPARLRGAAREFGNQMMQLKQMATERGRALYLEIDVEHQRRRIVDPPSVVDVPDARQREEDTFYGEWDTLPQGVRLEEIAFSTTDIEHEGSIVLDFEPDGELAPSGFVAFFQHVDLPEERGISVEVAGLTGLVAYHDGRFRAEETRRPEEF
jgi:prepilin-type N-terminal cleavage/methylation domain-containing protein